jgi:hypothetical protein
MRILALLFYANAALAAAVKGPDLLTGQPVEVQPGDKGTVAIFLSAKCPCSNSHVEEIKKIVKEYPAFHFVGIHSNPDEGKEQSQSYFKNAALNFPLIQDADGKLADEFRALKTPHAFIVTPDGQTVYKGGVTDSKNCDASGRNYLREALEDVSHNREVRTPAARTLGCAIARGEKRVW